jgi:diaminopimelate epimerase
MNSPYPFVKMHGLGNDCVVFDARATPLAIDSERARALAHRQTGIGCDQLIVLEKPRSLGTDAFMRIWNISGDEVEACGNATRCVADRLMRETNAAQVTIETVAGQLECERAAGGRVSVDMGPARLDWRDIPLREACDTNHVPLTLGPLADPAATNMGNPHATFFVPDVAAIDIAALGPKLEHHPIFPQRANIGVAQILAPDRLRLRVWERGAGLTLACGSGACASVVAASRRGLVQRRAMVIVDGGEMEIEWLPDSHVLMTGPAAVAFTGMVEF